MLGKPSRTTFTLFEPSLISLLKTNLYKQQKQTKKKKTEIAGTSKNQHFNFKHKK